MIRILNHERLLEFAAHATVPVINGLTRRSHPCQVMADLMTFEEHRGPIAGPHHRLDRRLTTMCWRRGSHAAERFGFNLASRRPPQPAPASW